MYDDQAKHTSQVESIFNSTAIECPRSSTKKNLHPDPAKEESLAAQLEKTRVKYGATIVEQFQVAYERQNPGLSFLFAQITNAIIEKVFHEGSCHAQAAYSLIEFCKKSIFNVSLVCSKTNNPSTEHWYLLLFDEFTFKALATQPSNNPTYFIFKPAHFKNEWTFFDPWSSQLCQWEDFQPKNSYTNAIKKAPQATFKPLIHLFRDEIGLLEKIIWCLTEYAERLTELNLREEQIPPEVSSLFTPTDQEFQEEIEFLFHSKQCIDKLLSTIEEYTAEFKLALSVYKPNTQPEEKKENLQEKETKLSSLTNLFFEQNPIPAHWKNFPESKLTGKYVGHRVCFFTMPQGTSTQAKAFVTRLKEGGIDVTLKTAAGDRPSIVVDLTASTLTL